MPENQEEEIENGNPAGGEESGQRKPRSAKRALTRPATLRRKKASGPAETPAPSAKAPVVETKPEPPKQVEREKQPPRRQQASRTRGRAASPRGRVAEEKETRTSRWDEEKFEIKSLPDGTQLKIKLSDSKPAKRKPTIRRRGDEDGGPGPAVVDLGEYRSPFQPGDRKINLGVLATQNRRAVTYLKRHLEVRPKVAVILGSGLFPVAELAEGEPIDFAKVPGFGKTSAQGHPGRLRAGIVQDTPTLFCEGRLHYYETMSMKDVVLPLKVFMALGVEYIILTTSAGGLNPSYRAGDMMFVKDQINLMGDNPLFGESPNSEPSPFVDVSAIYDEKMITQSERICRRIRVRRQAGVLAGMRGPVYETPAERNWLRSIGADAVCMSVIPESLTAASVGIPLSAIALIANDTTSMSSRVLTHEAVAQAGEKYASDVKNLIRAMLGAG
ncbi:MAG: purine-nucleoside phosphorylase [Nitrospinota bacterium]|nr:purine-nucleoside phosphorylase [Nitrospinota bacterium]MDH5677253.1 purine-nucleoside phosphorylase [Nitrospinota bacterium]MDH5756264.1 purine-nucleoside phosphorylase [Nitrospinota bacterium]